MSGFILLRGESDENDDLPVDDVEIFRDGRALLERIQGDPGGVAWVAIASDVADSSGVARLIRAADPNVSVVLQGAVSTLIEDVPEALRPTSARAERILRETHLRALEAEKLASIAALTAGIAHDVGTPMTAILGYAELIAKSVEDEKNRRRATTIVEQVHRVSSLIETLVNLSRTERGPLLPLVLSDILDKALDFYREKFKHRGVEVERHDRPAPRILGDAIRLHQVLLSLFLNALKEMPQGGTLRVALAETDSMEAEIRVSNSGTGIDPDLRARIFEPYFSTQQPAGGVGLGLHVAKTIVEEHGGRIALTSEPSHGTEFSLTFPPLREQAP